VTAAASCRGLWIVLAFACLVSFLSLDKAYHVDEPYYLAMAEAMNGAPGHWDQAAFNWHGYTMPWSRMNSNPSCFVYLLAAALKLTGGAEWAMRLFFLPFDLLAAAALYAIAARFLAKPLLPTLIVMAGPAYLINMPHLMGDKFVAAFGFSSICALLKGTDEDRPAWYWASAVLAAAATLAKLSSVFIVLLAAYHGWKRRLPRSRIIGYIAVSSIPACAYIGGSLLLRTGRAAAVWEILSSGQTLTWRGWIHRLRALLAFTGGCGVVTLAWPWLIGRAWKERLRTASCCFLAASFLFLPAFDWAKPPSLLDRMAGIVMAASALGCIRLMLDRKGRETDADLWMPWFAAVAFLQVAAYWGVVSRYVLFLLPPLVFSIAGRFEADGGRGSRRLHLAGLLAAAALSLALLSVDSRYAGAQKDLAEALKARYLDKGRRVWFTGHWGFQYYLEKAGAAGLDVNSRTSTWEAVRPGDVVVMPWVNVNIIPPDRPFVANMLTIKIDDPIPLRLMTAGSRNAGFYASSFGFLPFTISRRPLDRFNVIEML